MDNCYDEGVQIARTIDPGNLAKLVTDPNDSTNPNPSWLNSWDRFEVPVPDLKSEHDSEPQAPHANSNPVQVPNLLARVNHEPIDDSDPVATSRPGHLKPHMIQSIDTSLGLPRPGTANHDRLVSLESRVAQAEARIAAQDQRIYKLQGAVDKLEQVVSTSLQESE
ncbi:hypothetical protein HJFPF1_04041 [Paramyrothecium foliicola]|nr:hypothetical protein HJFPF1_04041 [Paramyrothecium foliicola]